MAQVFYVALYYTFAKHCSSNILNFLGNHTPRKTIESLDWAYEYDWWQVLFNLGQSSQYLWDISGIHICINRIYMDCCGALFFDGQFFILTSCANRLTGVLIFNMSFFWYTHFTCSIWAIGYPLFMTYTTSRKPFSLLVLGRNIFSIQEKNA